METTESDSNSLLLEKKIAQLAQFSFSQPFLTNQYTRPENSNGTSLDKTFMPFSNQNTINLLNFKADKKQPDQNSRISAFNQ